MIEFFKGGEFNPAIKVSEDNDNVSLDKLLDGNGIELKEVYAYEDGAMVIGNYWPPTSYWMLRKDNIDEEN